MEARGEGRSICGDANGRCLAGKLRERLCRKAAVVRGRKAAFATIFDAPGRPYERRQLLAAEWGQQRLNAPNDLCDIDITMLERMGRSPSVG